MDAINGLSVSSSAATTSSTASNKTDSVVKDDPKGFLNILSQLLASKNDNVSTAAPANGTAGSSLGLNPVSNSLSSQDIIKDLLAMLLFEMQETKGHKHHHKAHSAPPATIATDTNPLAAGTAIDTGKAVTAATAIDTTNMAAGIDVTGAES